MLVFRLKVGDTIEIGDVRLEVKKVADKVMRLAIAAPKDQPINHMKNNSGPSVGNGPLQDTAALHK